jgi:hypothetical protein
MFCGIVICILFLFSLAIAILKDFEEHSMDLTKDYGGIDEDIQRT